MFTYDLLPLGLFGVGVYLVIRSWTPPPYSWQPPPLTDRPWTAERIARHAEWTAATAEALVRGLNKAVRLEAEQDALRELAEDYDREAEWRAAEEAEGLLKRLSANARAQPK